MKKLITIVMMTVLAVGLFAQTPKEEAIQSLENAKKLIQQDNISKAQEEINFASNKLSEIIAEQLVLYIPDAPTGFTLEDKSASGLGQMGGIMGSANASTAVGHYSATKEDKDGNTADISLTISLGGILGQTAGLAAMGQMFSGMGYGTNTKTIRVGGYNGTLESSKDSSTSKLSVQVGNKVSIMVEGDYLANPEIMKTLVEKIDLAKLEKAF